MKIKNLMHIWLAIMLVLTCSGANAMDEALGVQIENPTEKNLHEFAWDRNTLGTLFNMGSDGQLKAEFLDRKGMDGKSIEESYMPLYLFLSQDDPRKMGGLFFINEKELKVPSLSINRRRIMCGQGATFLLEDKIEIVQCLFRSQSRSQPSTLKFVGKRMVFANTIFDGELLNTTLVLCPLASLNSPIEYIKIIPKEKCGFIEGTIDFTAFTIQGFVVAKSDVVMKMKR